MELLQHLLPNQTGLALNRWNLDTANGRIVVELSSTSPLKVIPRLLNNFCNPFYRELWLISPENANR